MCSREAWNPEKEKVETSRRLVIYFCNTGRCIEASLCIDNVSGLGRSRECCLCC